MGALGNKLCPACHQQTVQETAYCKECAAPLKRSSLHCKQCNHRHGMSTCNICGYELFKHAAFVVTRKYVRQPNPQDKLFPRLWRQIHRPTEKQTQYFHRHCTQAFPEVLNRGKVRPPSEKPSQEIVPPSNTLKTNLVVPPSLPSLKVSNVSLTDGQRIEPEQSRHDSLTSSNSEDIELLKVEIQYDTPTNTSQPHQTAIQNNLKTSSTEQFVQDYKTGIRDFSGLNLGNTIHKNLSLVGIDLQEADLSGSEWACVDLAQSNLSCSNLDQAKFREANFKRVMLRDASIQRAQIFLSNFCAANLSGANMQASDFYASYFQKADLTQANLSQTKLDAADLSWANLLQANLEEASLIEAILKGASLEYSRLLSSNLTWANLQNACLIGANLNNANVLNSDLKGADFSYSQLINTNLSHTNLSEANSLREAHYSENTRFPSNFNPEEYAMIKV